MKKYMSLAEAAIFEYAFKLGMQIAIETLTESYITARMEIPCRFSMCVNSIPIFIFFHFNKTQTKFKPLGNKSLI